MKFRKLTVLSAWALFVSFSLPHSATACTGIMLKNTDNTYIHGRTLEFGLPLSPSMAVIPRGYRFVGQTPNGDGLSYTVKYATVGFITFDDIQIMDGMNEKGLSAGAFFFPGFAEYTPVTEQNQAKALSPGGMVNWILTQFSSVAEVRQAVSNGDAVIVPTVMQGWGSDAPPAHFIVYDKTGACIVIEPVGGKLIIHDNPLGAMSNAPTFDWHLTNLRNYIKLSAVNATSVDLSGMTFSQLGQGSGLLGLPGDFTPPSRFVRAALYSASALQPASSAKGIFEVFHILNNFDIPKGVVKDKPGDTEHGDYTMLTVARDPQNLCYYYKTYEDQTIRKVDLGTFDLTADNVKLLKISGEQPIIDMSNQLK